MKVFGQRVMYFLASFCAVLCASLSFYYFSNKYTKLGESAINLSIYTAYGSMLVLWGFGLFLAFKQKKIVLLEFAAFVSAVALSLDYMRTWVYIGDEPSKTCVYVIMLLLASVCVTAVFKKKYETSLMSLASCVIACSGDLFIYPKVVLIQEIILVSAVFYLSFVLFRINKYKTGITMIVVCLIGVWFRVYQTSSGIRFYEKKVLNPATEVKVSIIVPVYNAENTISRCLDSLRRQSLKEIEIICVDDGSTDKTPEILAKYAAFDARIKVIRQENAYIGAARNRGIGEAKGEYIGFVDNDDYVSENYYEELYKAAKKQQADIAVAEKIMEIHTNRKVINKIAKSLKNQKGNPLTDKTNFLENACGYVWNKIFNRSFLQANNISFVERRAIYDDMIFSLNAYMYTDKIALAPETTYYFIRHNSSASINVEDPTKYLSKLKAIKDMFSDFEQKAETSGLPEDQLIYWKNEALKQRKSILENEYKIIQSKENKAKVKSLILELFPKGEFDFLDE